MPDPLRSTPRLVPPISEATAAEVLAAPGPGGYFAGLLSQQHALQVQLAAEHLRVVGGLNQEIDSLRARIGGDFASAPVASVAPPPPPRPEIVKPLVQKSEEAPEVVKAPEVDSLDKPLVPPQQEVGGGKGGGKGPAAGRHELLETPWQSIAKGMGMGKLFGSNPSKRTKLPPEGKTEDIETPKLEKSPSGRKGSFMSDIFSEAEGAVSLMTNREARAEVEKIANEISNAAVMVIPASHKHSHLFQDVNERIKSIRHAILNPYNVAEYYHHTGWCKAIAESKGFEGITLGVVCANSLWIAIDADVNGSTGLLEKHPFFQSVDGFFFVYFLGEWLIRFGAFRNKLDGFCDMWFVFDGILALLMCVDTGMAFLLGSAGGKTSVLRLFRLVKMIKMGRIARLLRKCPEMAILVKAIYIAGRSVMSTGCLMTLVAYVFSVAFRLLTMDSAMGDTYFESVPHGMRSLLLPAVFPDMAELITDMGEGGFLFEILAIIFSVISTMALMNMLIGVMCEVIATTAEVEKEAIKTLVAKEKLLAVLGDSGFAASPTMKLTKNQFKRFMVEPEAIMALREIGVDPVGLVEYTDYIFGEGRQEIQGGITFHVLIDLLLNLGGSNKATVKDVIDMRKVVLQQLEKIEDAFGIVHSKLDAQVSAAMNGMNGMNAMPAPVMNQDISMLFQKAASVSQSAAVSRVPNGYAAQDALFCREMQDGSTAFPPGSFSQGRLIKELSEKEGCDLREMQSPGASPMSRQTGVDIKSGSPRDMMLPVTEQKDASSFALVLGENSSPDVLSRLDEAQEEMRNVRVQLDLQLEQQTQQFRTDLATVLSLLQNGRRDYEEILQSSKDTREDSAHFMRVLFSQFTEMRAEGSGHERHWQEQTKEVQNALVQAMHEKKTDQQTIMQLLEDKNNLTFQLTNALQAHVKQDFEGARIPATVLRQSPRPAEGALCARNCGPPH